MKESSLVDQTTSKSVQSVLTFNQNRVVTGWVKSKSQTYYLHRLITKFLQLNLITLNSYFLDTKSAIAPLVLDDPNCLPHSYCNRNRELWIYTFPQLTTWLYMQIECSSRTLNYSSRTLNYSSRTLNYSSRTLNYSSRTLNQEHYTIVQGH